MKFATASKILLMGLALLLASSAMAATKANLTLGDQVTVKACVRDDDYPDIPLGGWSGVVKELDDRKLFTIVVFDAEPIAIKEMAAGNIDAMVVQNPYQMGYSGVRLMKALYEKDQKTIHQMLPQVGHRDGDVYDTGLKVVVPSSESPLHGEMFGPKTEFLTLDQFKEWLARYSLEGS